MDPLQDYLKSMNPKESNDTQGLFYGAKYVCFLEGKLIGTYTWSKDENVGDSFQRTFIEKDGQEITEVGLPDLWLLLPDKEQDDILRKQKLNHVLQRLSDSGIAWRFENEHDDLRFYLSIIDRQIYPRLWKDNDMSGEFKILAKSEQALLEEMTVGIVPDWSERWNSNSMEGCLFQAYEWMSKNNIK